MHKLGKNKTIMSMITHQMDGEGEGKISYFNMITSRTYISSEMDIKTTSKSGVKMPSIIILHREQRKKSPDLVSLWSHLIYLGILIWRI